MMYIKWRPQSPDEITLNLITLPLISEINEADCREAHTTCRIVNVMTTAPWARALRGIDRLAHVKNPIGQEALPSNKDINAASFPKVMTKVGNVESVNLATETAKMEGVSKHQSPISLRRD